MGPDAVIAFHRACGGSAIRGDGHGDGQEPAVRGGGRGGQGGREAQHRDREHRGQEVQVGMAGQTVVGWLAARGG